MDVSLLTQVFDKSKTFLFHWSSKIPNKYERYAITEKLHRAKQIAPDFDKGIHRVREKYRHTGFSWNLVNDAICNLEKETEETITSIWLFEERKTFAVGLLLMRNSANEKFSKSFIKKILIIE